MTSNEKMVDEYYTNMYFGYKLTKDECKKIYEDNLTKVYNEEKEAVGII